MKVTLMIVIPLVIFIVINIITMGAIKKDAAIMTSELNKVEASVSKEDWSKAEQALRKIDEEWKETRKTWKAFIDHFEVDMIDVSMVKVGEYIKTENKEDCTVEIAVLKHLIHHIPEIEKLSLSNIL